MNPFDRCRYVDEIRLFIIEASSPKFEKNTFPSSIFGLVLPFHLFACVKKKKFKIGKSFFFLFDNHPWSPARDAISYANMTFWSSCN